MDQLPVSSSTPDAPADAELLCAQVRRMASIALGVDMDHDPGAVRQAAVDAYPTHPDPTSVPWPDQIACPFRPVGMRGQWYVFEERYPAPGYGRRQVFLSDYQVRFGEIVAPLNLREDWLADQFPMAGGNFQEWDIVAVVAWIRHHINAATTTRRDRGPRDTPRSVAAEPRPAPDAWSMAFGLPEDTIGIPRLKTMVAQRGADGRTTLAVTFTLPGGREVHGARVIIPPTPARELADVLRGVVAL